MKTPRWRGRSLRTKIIVATVLLMATAVGLIAVVVQLVLNNLVTKDVDRVLQARAANAVSAIRNDSGARVGLRVPRSAVDTGVVVLDAASGRVVSGVFPEQWEHHDFVGLNQKTMLTVGEKERLLAVPFVTGAGQHGVAVVSERLAPYEQSERYALLATVSLGIVVTLGAGFIAAWTTHRALAPVGEMSAQAVEWGDHDLDKRFDLGEAGDEITGLGAALDTLLDRVAHSLRAEQRLTSELAHELRTPLTSVQATADLWLLSDDLPAGLREDLEQISESAHRMATTITTLVELARSATNGVEGSWTTLGEVLDRVFDTAGSAKAVELQTPGADRALRLALPTELAVRAVSPVLENAHHHAMHGISVATRRSGRHVDISIANDGPPVAPDDIERIFEPGVTTGTSGAGLGLPLARRIARSAGGDVFVEESLAGAHFVVRLPRAAGAAWQESQSVSKSTAPARASRKTNS